ncbi:MAG: hypothetical protein AABY53_02290 [Bdellovibrionota bacterium]
MQSFKQKKQPLLKLIFSNAAVQIILLIVATVFVGQYLFRNQAPQSWVQKITHFQGISKSKKSLNSAQSYEINSEESRLKNQFSDEAPAPEQSESFQNQARGSSQIAEASSSATASASSSLATSDAQNLSSINFKISYVEISTEVLSKLITDSTNLGLYQNLATYSAGIINDFKKRGDTFRQILKTTDLKIALATSNSNLSGTMSPDGSQILGLVTSIEYKSNENDIIQGDISVTSSSSQNSEFYPAEFALPKGSAFFIIGAIKRDSFRADQAKLTMPPFQIFKSADFMTRKTEFVIIIEPLYN